MTAENRNDERWEERLTAYAFGELEGEELAAMEAALAADPELAARVAELRAFGDEMSMALLDEPAPFATTAPPRAAAENEARGRVLRFPAWAWATGIGLAAAGVALVVWTHDELPAPRREEMASVETTPAPTPPPIPAPAVVAEPAPRAIDEEASRLVIAPPIETPSPENPALMSDEVEAVPEPGMATVRDAPEPGPVMAVVDAPAIEVPALPMPAPVLDRGGEVRAMLDKGRGQYAAGDLDAAAASFEAVMKMDPRNRNADYFSARIAQEKAHDGTGATKTALRRRSSNPVGRLVAEAPDRTRPTARSFSGRSDPRSAIVETGFVAVKFRPISTFSADVDTGSYALLRRTIRSPMKMAMMGSGFDRDALRIEELINYFPYSYAPPITPDAASDAAVPFAAHLAVASAPWAPEHRLVRIGLKARELASEARPPANLVFVIDVSGSMGMRGGLSLAKASLLQLVGRLRPDDHVAITTFADKAELVLASTPVEDLGKIRDALNGLEVRGSTNVKVGIELGYETAQEFYRPDAVNRVILCTDGMFNPVGKDGRQLFELVREKARGRVFLTVLGFGVHSPREDENLEVLADKGNGVYGFIDSVNEARKILGEEVDGTLATIAKDVKIQVEFNPDRVSSYRLIGYENRALQNTDFENETVDAGEVGAGHEMTAIYEIEPKSKRVRKRPDGDASVIAEEDRLLTVKVRYKETPGEEDKTRTLEFPLADADVDFEDADEDFRFAAAVAAWGMLLRDSSYKGRVTLDDVGDWAKDCLGYDPGGYREEFIEIVKASDKFIHRRSGGR